MLQYFVSPCRKSHALLQFFVKEALRGQFLPNISRNAAFFRQKPGLQRWSAENLTHCCIFSASPVENIKHCGFLPGQQAAPMIKGRTRRLSPDYHSRYCPCSISRCPRSKPMQGIFKDGAWRHSCPRSKPMHSVVKDGAWRHSCPRSQPMLIQPACTFP